MRQQLIAIGAITVASILWGTTGTAASFAPEAGPLAIGAAALGVGGALQALVALPALRRAGGQLRANLPLVCSGGLAVAIYPLTFYSSMHLAGVAVGTVVSLASAPLASGVLERCVQHVPLSRWWLIAVALGIVGSALLCYSKMTFATGDFGSTIGGIILGLVAGTSYAGYSWAAHRLMNRGIGRAASMGAVFGTGALLLLPVLLLKGAQLTVTSDAFMVSVYMALIPMFLGYLLFGYGLTRITASTATTITMSEPAIAAILAVTIVGERLTTIGWVGLGVIALVLAVLSCAPANASTARAGRPGTAREVIST
ncbi:EamA family transporter [Arthrobacter castelli]|uniref:EamA family transporter n=1 Tax=Arthrobacter castelli TaxID=271431 RepID=UPI0003FACDC7|nr:EamA family transporter [Arthrobacter castelli]